MKRFVAAILSTAATVGLLMSPAWAQDVSRLNQDMDNRPNLQSEQTVSGLTSKPGVDVQQPLPTASSGFRSKRHSVKTSKTSRRLTGAAAASGISANQGSTSPTGGSAPDAAHASGNN